MKSYSFADIAKSLIVSLRTVETWHESGELRAINASRNRQSRKPRLRVLQDDLDAFLVGRATNQSSGRPPARPRQKIEVEQFV